MAPPLPQRPDESTADYFEYLLRWMPGTHGGLLCPQRFMYEEDDKFVAAVREWNAARSITYGPLLSAAIWIIVIIAVVFTITMLMIGIDLGVD